MYRRVSDIFPITYGKKAPSGFGGAPDIVQQRFNRLVHLSIWPHDASYAEIDAGMVVSIPRWEHWVVFGELPSELSDDQVREVLAAYKATLDAIARAIGVSTFDRHDYHARITLRNELVFEEWLVDFAEREGMFVESARAYIRETQEAAASSARSAVGHIEREPGRKAEIEDFDLSGYAFDPVCHDRSVSFERTREEIAARKERMAEERKNTRGLTIRDMNELGLSYRDIDGRHGYRIADDAEVVVVSLKTGKVTGHTGKFVARIVDAMAVKEAARSVGKVGEAISDVLDLFVQPSQLFMCL